MSTRLCVAVAAVAALASCRQATIVPPLSLDSPVAVAVARGQVCLSSFEDSSHVVQYTIDACPQGTTGAIGLVANERSDRLAILDLSQSSPRLIDLDPSTPGLTHLKVGRLPVDVAASVDGTAAYTLNQLDRDVSIVDLWNLEVQPERYQVDKTPIKMGVDPTSGQVVVAAGSPSTMYAFQGSTFCQNSKDCAGVPDDMSPQTIDLPGTVSDFVFDPHGDEAWVVYRDLDYASIVSFDPTPDGFDTACLDGIDSKPCVVANVSLTYDCSDGLDNDGDGLVDEQDPQCYSPRSSETPLGIAGQRGNGRVIANPSDDGTNETCDNGIDDNNDGLTDRDDPNCAIGSGDETTPLFSTPPTAACNDEVDNDHDGLVDYPDDPECYGGYGRTEATVPPVGFDKISVDPQGSFFYVVDRAGEQVLVVDGRRKKLIDTPRSESPARDAFDVQLGIDVSPSPLSVQGIVDRHIVWADPADEKHAVIRYDYGAWVSENNGSLQYVDTAVTYCEVHGEKPVSRQDFWQRKQGPVETECLDLPQFPLQSATARVVAGSSTLPVDCKSADFTSCATCREMGNEPCDACKNFKDTQFDLCQRGFEYGQSGTPVTLYVNPRFSLRDGGGDEARILGSGTCDQPDALLTTMQDYATAHPAGPQDLKCNSPLMAQPLQTAAAETTDARAIASLQRADLLQMHTLQFDTANANAPLVGVTPYDARTFNESVTVTYEGVIPGASGSNGVLDKDRLSDGTVWLSVGFDACGRDVEPGDRVTITSDPKSGCDLGGDAIYAVAAVESGRIRLATIDEKGLATKTPDRACYSQAVNYEVRPHDEWTVVGDTVGFLSPYKSEFGQCVPRYESANITSRAVSGAVYKGPYFSFYLYPGFAPDAVKPVQDMAFTFQISNGLQAVAYATCGSLGQTCSAGLYPVQVLWVPGLPSGSLLLAPDPDGDFIHVRNLDDSSGGYSVVR